jgi:HAMP domain-containing protein
MIVSCEKCGKKYKIDETKLKETKTLFKCEGCGSIMEAIKPSANPFQGPKDDISPSLSVDESPADANPEEDLFAASTSSTKPAKPKTKQKKKKAPKGPGMSIRLKLLIGFLFFITILGGVITFLYQYFVPTLVEQEIHQRTYSISKSFSAAVSNPLLLNNYIQVNKAAEVIAGLPGVAYASVLNKRGIIVAGIFGNTVPLDPVYKARIAKERFPIELARLNALPQGKEEIAKKIIVGGQNVYDVAVTISGAGGEAHVGIYTADAENLVRQSLPRLLIVLGGLGFIGALSFFFAVSMIVSKPIRHLTDAAHRISLGEIDHPIISKGGGEVAELAASLERMRFSIKSAIDRLRRR